MGKIHAAAAAAGIVLLLATGTLSACSNQNAPARAVAEQLAAGIAAMDLAQVPLAGPDATTATTELRALAEPLQPVAPAISVGDVTLNADSASAVLNFSWPFDSGTWSYSTSADLVRQDGGWKARWAPSALVPNLQPGDRLQMDTSLGKRGRILGDGGEVLVTERPVVRLGLDKSHVEPEQQQSSAMALAGLVGVDPGGFATQVAAAGPAAFVEALVLRDDATRTITDEQLAGIPGATALADSLPLAPTRNFARPVLGSVGQATAELIEQSNGALHEGDTTGLSGLQQQYNDRLRGTPGLRITRVPAVVATGGGGATGATGDGGAAATAVATGTPTPGGAAATAESTGTPDGGTVLFTTKPSDGADLTITLNARLQSLAEQVLSDETATPTAIVALRPSNGAVLAAASGPGSNGYNTALLGQYAPGSTFKVATSLALLRHGQTPDSTESCTPTITVDGKSFKNANGYPEDHLGPIPLRDAFAHSCNTAFISNADLVSQSDLASAAASLGLGVDADLGTTAFLGAVPDSAAGTAHAAAMIGQGEVLVSPLAAAVSAASVQHGGRVSPRLVTGEHGGPTSAPSSNPSNPSSPATSNPTSSNPASPLTGAESDQLQELMRGVVTSGHAGFLADVPGEPVIAKTGTAEYGTELPLKTHAWIIAAQGDLAVAVFVEDGDYGAVSGGPLLKNFLIGATKG